MASFVLLVLGGTAVSTLLGSRIITQALINQALRRVQHDLVLARIMCSARLDRVRRMVVRSASSEALVTAARAHAQDAIRKALGVQMKKEGALDFLAFVSRDGHRVTRESGSTSGSFLREPIRSLTRRAVRESVVTSVEVFDRQALHDERHDLAQRARVGPVIGAADNEATSGLVLLAAKRIVDGTRIIGVAYGGVLLNRSHEEQERANDLIFGGRRYEVRDQGVVSLFLGAVRVSASINPERSHKRIGKRVSAEVGRKVLVAGDRWVGRTRINGSWHVAAYEPLHNRQGTIIGILGLELPERPLLSAWSEMMVTFLSVAIIGVAIVIGLSYVVTRNMIFPLEEMVEGTKKIAAGNLDHRVKVHSRDEIGLLAESFNQMLDSIKKMSRELRGWGRTLERRVKDRTQELVAVQAKMAQSEKMASLGRVAAGVAHEINNPLGGILSFSMLALEECAADHKMKKRLEIISKQALRCREIVKGLLDFARQSETSTALTDLTAIAEKTLFLLESQQMLGEIRVVRVFQDDLPRVQIDPDQLQQVVANLVLNAIDAMGKTGVLTVETSGIPQRDMVLLAVGDTGKGIPKEVAPLIFEPFFTTKKVGQGIGLGLSIAHGIVTRAKGRIDFESSEHGTKFLVCFPGGGQERRDSDASRLSEEHQDW